MKTSIKYLISTWIIVTLLLVTTTTSQFIIGGLGIICFGMTTLHIVEEETRKAKVES